MRGNMLFLCDNVWFYSVLLIMATSDSVLAQDIGAEDCFSGGSVAGAAVGSFIAALILVFAFVVLRKYYWKSRKGAHLILSTDPESAKHEFAFDNAGFRHAEGAPAWLHLAPTLPRTQDDCLRERTGARERVVRLAARDFTGLGFAVGGGARDGLRVRRLLRAGPAAQAGLNDGDLIKAINISFSGMVLEDAVAILSLASPYAVELRVETDQNRAPASTGTGNGTGTGTSQYVCHPVYRLRERANSSGDVRALEKSLPGYQAPKSPNTSHSNNSTLEHIQNKAGGIKKIITEKIITTTTLERAKKEKKDAASTLERENEKNTKLAKNRLSDVPVSKPERNKTRYSSGDVPVSTTESMTVSERIERAETQKKEADAGKKGMKFGIRVLPPNIPDDGLLKNNKNSENGHVVMEKESSDEVDKYELGVNQNVAIKMENEIAEQPKSVVPVVAKRREKTAPPIPNARNINKTVENVSVENQKPSEDSIQESFVRDHLNSSSVKRDKNGIPQELPQHMMEAAMFAQSNRRSSTEVIEEGKKDVESEAVKATKKSKGKAPSPPEKSADISNINVTTSTFIDSEIQHSNLSNNTFESFNRSYNTSTPKADKSRSYHTEESVNFTQDDIDDIVSRPFKKESDSLNNFFEDSKSSRSNVSSNMDGNSFVSFNHEQSDKGSTTLELNSSDVTVHSSPLNETLQNVDHDISIEDSERKATSLGDLSRLENNKNVDKKSSQGTLERAQSLDITVEDLEQAEKPLSPKKRKANSVIESSFYDDAVSEMVVMERNSKNKEPRLSLNLSKPSAMDGLNTFQRNRLKKASEFGNLEDAIVKTSSSNLNSDTEELNKEMRTDSPVEIVETDNDEITKKLLEQNLKLHLKLVSEFSKSSKDLDETDAGETSQANTSELQNPVKLEEKLSLNYDTNISDDVKVSRHTLVNSLERPKSDMMKKLLAKNPTLNVHLDPSLKSSESSHSTDDPVKPSEIEVTTESVKSKSVSTTNQPDIVSFNVKTTEEPKPERDLDTEEFVSNIRIGPASIRNENMEIKPNFSIRTETEIAVPENIVTISTEGSQPSSIITIDSETKTLPETFTKSIEINKNFETKDIPDLISNDALKPITKHSKTYFTENVINAPQTNVEIRTTETPVQRTTTVNVAEDEFGNKIIMQNIQEVSTKYVTMATEAPLQVEEMTFGIIKNPSDLEKLTLEDITAIHGPANEEILNEIKRQNPNMHFITDEPAFSNTETIILNTDLDEKDALALMEKLKENPNFMSQNSDLTNLGINVVRDLEEETVEGSDRVTVSRTRYALNPAMVADDKTIEKKNVSIKSFMLDDEVDPNYITEIQVVTPRTEKIMKQAENKNMYRSEPYVDLSCELDKSVLDDFLMSERHHSELDLHKNTRKDLEEVKNKRHSDYDLPRNSQIKFRTATYESPRSNVMNDKRLSQIEILRSNFEKGLTEGPSPVQKPAISAKPSSIPIKMPERSMSKPNLVSPSKIPVFTSQKSLSQENLSDKSLSVVRNSPPKNSPPVGANISITSIKSSSKNPSGK